MSGSTTGSGEVFAAFLRLGLTAFGGPVAHIGYFRNEFVARRKWLDDAAYADLVALCQFLPGPASSQTGIGLGMMRAGPAGALAAWTAFTLPSAVLMTLAAFSLIRFGQLLPDGLLGGLKAVVVGVVAHALIGMGRSLTPDLPRIAIAALALGLALSIGGVPGQLAAIGIGAAAGWMHLAGPRTAGREAPFATMRRGLGITLLAVFALLLGALPLMALALPGLAVQVADGFYRSGALVFGGGHVVLPLLQAETVAPGLVGAADFTAGYGLAQAVPGPLFSFAAFLGATAGLEAGAGPAGAIGLAALALAMIFLPGALLVAALLPVWSGLRASARARRVLDGINAAVVGILAAALYDPVWRTAIADTGDLAIALAAYAALAVLKWPAWAIVPLGAAAGVLVARLPAGAIQPLGLG